MNLELSTTISKGISDILGLGVFQSIDIGVR